MNPLLNALCKKLEGEIAMAKANIQVYQTNPAGIGEHPDLIEAIESQIDIMATAEDKLASIHNHFGHGYKK
jgi:hypothetical protein